MTPEMKSIVDELNKTVSEFAVRARGLSEEKLHTPPRPGKWSPIEVIGHLSDSAHSNLRRFVTGQYEAKPPNITYEQEFWVKANDYQHAPTHEVIDLWVLLNRRIAAVLTQMPPENYIRNVDTGRGQENLHTLIWLAADYVKHMKHHLNQVIAGSYDVTYP